MFKTYILTFVYVKLRFFNDVVCSEINDVENFVFNNVENVVFSYRLNLILPTNVLEARITCRSANITT